MYSVDNLISYDLEVYPNYFLAGFLFPDGKVYQYEFTADCIDHLSGLIEFIDYVEKSEFTLVGF